MFKNFVLLTLCTIFLCGLVFFLYTSSVCFKSLVGGPLDISFCSLSHYICIYCCRCTKATVMIKDVCLHWNTTLKAEWGLYVCVALYHCETSWCCSACTFHNFWTLSVRFVFLCIAKGVYTSCTRASEVSSHLLLRVTILRNLSQKLELLYTYLCLHVLYYNIIILCSITLDAVMFLCWGLSCILV